MHEATTRGDAARPRLLMLAYACRPGSGSESGVGWNRALQAARWCDTWVLCSKSCEAEVRAWLATHGPLPGLTFVFQPWSRAVRLLRKFRGLYYASLRLWNRQALATARTLHPEVGFDLTHHATYCGYRQPGGLWKLGLPHVWGPVGGTQNVPWRFLLLPGLRPALREAARHLVNEWQLHSRRVRRAARASKVLLAANERVRWDLHRALGVDPPVLLETGIPRVAERHGPGPRPGEPLRIAWAGELLPFKGLGLLLAALARLPADVPWKLDVLGDGPMARRWRRAAGRLGIGERITWAGWLPQEQVLDRIGRAHALVFTSLRDTSGNVVLEALSVGVPVVCLDHQGVRDIVTPACGIKIPVTRPAEAMAGLAAALGSLARGEIDWPALADGALARARHYLWDRQGERMAEVYEQALGAPLRRRGSRAAAAAS